MRRTIPRGTANPSRSRRLLCKGQLALIYNLLYTVRTRVSTVHIVIVHCIPLILLGRVLCSVVCSITFAIVKLAAILPRLFSQVLLPHTLGDDKDTARANRPPCPICYSCFGRHATTPAASTVRHATVPWLHCATVSCLERENWTLGTLHYSFIPH